MAWVLLIVAGLLEVVWAAALPEIDRFTKPVPTAIFLVGLAGSMALLARATETIPLGTAYVVWVGIGAVGAAFVGIAAHGDPVTPARLLFVALLVVGIVGVKVTSH
jgi:quaternary ammonium compound-resistance protein SugE